MGVTGASLSVVLLTVLVSCCRADDAYLWDSLLAIAPEELDDDVMLNDGVESDPRDDLWNSLVTTTPAFSSSFVTTPMAEGSAELLSEVSFDQVLVSSTVESFPSLLAGVELPSGAAGTATSFGARSPGTGASPAISMPSEKSSMIVASSRSQYTDPVSLAFVFDSTGSMRRDLEQLKRGASAILSTMLSRPDKPIKDYIFVPFNDPVVGPANVTSDPEVFRAQLDSVEVHGGSDCPEPSLAALLQALKLVRPNSYVYVFTDASAKDYELLPDVLALVQRKQTQVVFVMSGNCKDGNTARYQSMENIAAASSGQVYHVNKTEIENVLGFVRQTLESEKVNLISVDLPDAATKEHALQIDETIREFTVSVSGENPRISVVDPDGVRVDSPPTLQNILDLDHVKVVAVKEPTRGSWTVETSSDSKHAVRLTGLSVVDFAYGFSAQLTNRLDETYHRPLQDATNFILVGGTDMGSVWNLTSVDLLAIDGSTLVTVPLTPLQAPDGLYRGGPFLPPGEDKLFYLANFGYGRDGYPIKRITPTAISAQAGALPIVQLRADQTVWLNDSLTLHCQIDSLVPFTAWFFKDGIPISKKQKYQQTAVMTMKVNQFTEEMGGNYVCRASNVKGYSKDVVHVVVTGPPPEVMTESQLQIQPWHKVTLDCYVRSKLRVNVTWVRIHSAEDRELVENNARYVLLPNSSLVIDPALTEDTGLFSCVAENQGGRRESKIHLVVKDPLQVKVEPKIVRFQKGDSFSISCEANSLPSIFYWERDGVILQKKSPGHITEVKGHRLVLHVYSAKKNDQAVYHCVGINERDTVKDKAEVYYIEMPSVEIENKPDVVKVGDNFNFTCVSHGVPKPETRWLWQGSSVKLLPNFETSEDGVLQILSVQPTHAGQLDCVAKNLLGEVKDSFNLTVGYAPAAVVKPQVLQLEIEGTGSLACTGSAVPEPFIIWERKDGKDIDFTRIQFEPSSGTLLFSGAQVDDEGVYVCIVENKFGQAFSEGTVEIFGIVAPGFEKDVPSLENITVPVGKEVDLLCHVSFGNPTPLIVWFKEDSQLSSLSDLDVSLEKNGSVKIFKAGPRHSGRYRCEARNVGGFISRVILLRVMDAPVLESSNMLSLTEKVGNNALLPCRAHGTPQPEILWLQSDSSPIALTERILQTYEGLVVIGVEPKDAGAYTCMALNDAGSANRSIYLTIQDPPSIHGEKVLEIVANVGDVLSLPCSATGDPSPDFIWSHNYEYFSFNDHIFPSTNSDGLVITSVDVNDSGVYHCSAINDAGSANKTISLTVQEPPHIELQNPPHVIAAEGTSAKLLCRAKGVPEPRVVWTFKGQPVVSGIYSNTDGEHILAFFEVYGNDSGTYICTAFNAAGSDARGVKLTVLVVPKIEAWIDSLKVMESKDLILNCHFYGIPYPKAFWYKDGVLISPTVTTETYIQYRVSAKLSHAGKYKCEAVSDIGNTSKVVDVEVLVPPMALEPPFIFVESMKGDKLILECLSSHSIGHPYPAINWTLNGHPINSSNFYNLYSKQDLYIEEVDPSHTGVYVCKAVNEAGSSSRTFNVSVKDPPHILEDFVETTTLMEGEDFSIPCSAGGIPKPHVLWKFNNHSLSPAEDYANLLLMNDNTLVIISAQANTSGVYMCVAQNEVGEDRQQTYVEVYVPPSLSGDDVIHQEVNEGDNVMLTCPSSDATEVDWRQNGVPLDFTANERSDEAHFKLLDGGKTLAIFESRPTDNGTYTCTASNPVGQMKATFYLEVLWAPFFEEFGASQKEFTITEGSSVSFDCLSSGSPTPKVIWKINESLPITERTSPGVVVLSSSRHLLTIPVVRAHHDGLYQCQAINRVGYSNRRFLLRVIVPPYLEDDTEDHYEVLRGDTVTLVCPVKGSPEPVFSWSANISLQLDWDHGHVEFQNNSQVMIIPNIDFSAGGVYICNGSNQAGFELKRFNVSIMEAPSIVDGDKEEELNVAEGEILILDCTARGQPLPDMQWTHNGHMLSSDNLQERYDLDTSSVTQTLRVDFSSVVLSGKYVCHATNNRGAAEKVFKIRFQVPPKINGEEQTVIENVTSVQGLPLSLNCHSVGEPAPTVFWFQNGTPLKSDVYIMVDGGHKETLHFKHLHRHQSGNYTCVARNSAGTASKVFLLDVYVPPYHPNNVEEIRKNVLYHENLTLDCDFRGHPSPKLMWIRGVEPVSEESEDFRLSNNNHTLSISSVNPSHAGRYSCLAFNEAGSAELLFHVNISETPNRNEAVTQNFTLITLRPLRRFMLLCAMTGSPSPVITWFKANLSLENGGLNGSIQISSDGRQLHILNALQDHEGIYKCHAENAVGFSEAFFQLVMDDKGEWREWSEWSPCSVSCGFGIQERKRDCLTSKCSGESQETQQCFMSYCPVNGVWSNWSNWTKCNQECGQHEKIRSRECNNPEPAYGGLPCEGDKMESESCNLPPCPIDGDWSAWSEWSQCSVTCGQGVQSRHRVCNNPEPAHGGLTCEGFSGEVSNCTEEPCLGDWSDWSDWTPCSTTCGPGMRQRRRKCKSEWSNCLGDNKQFEYCKLRRCVGDLPRRARIFLHGNLNGHNLLDDSLYADISGDEVSKRGLISSKLHRIHKREVSIQPIFPLLLSPVSWSVAYEDKEASNGYSLTKGLFQQDSQVHFAAGQEMKMRHVGQGVDSAGQLKVDIEVIGEVPYIQPTATIVVEPFSEDFVQTGPNTLHVTSEGTLSADGHIFPYSLNSTVSYNHDEGFMQYFSEKMTTDHIETDFDSDLQEMRYTVSSVISQKFTDNKCPEGFVLNAEQQHCEDMDECSYASLNKCHVTQVCENLLGSYRCSCPSGFRALKIGSRCLDVNECLQEPPLCSHDCRNIPGSYRCICPPGTFLLEDRHSCSVSPYWDDPDDAYGTSDLIGEASQDSKLGEALEPRSDYSDDSKFPRSLQESRLAAEEWSCAEGLAWIDGQCQDRDECLEEPDICGEDETCINVYKTFKCMYTPCGEGYKRDSGSRDCLAYCGGNMYCKTGAKVAEKKTFMAVSLDSRNNEQGMDLVHFSVSHDIISTEHQHSHTKYYFENPVKGKMFRLRQEKGKCVIFSLKKLKAGKVYRVEVRGDTYSDNTENLLYSTMFTTFFHVLKGR